MMGSHLNIAIEDKSSWQMINGKPYPGYLRSSGEIGAQVLQSIGLKTARGLVPWAMGKCPWCSAQGCNSVKFH